MRKTMLCVLAISWIIMGTGHARADQWRYPDEISVAGVYNTFYGTAYDETTREGLKDLYADHQGDMLTSWNTSFLRTLDVLVYDTSSTVPLAVGKTAADKHLIFDPGPWTSSSRGHISMETVDLVALLGENTEFSFYFGSTVLNPFNTLMIKGSDYSSNGTFFLAHNQGGWSGDADFNEPLMVANAIPTPEPGTLLLLGAGLVGVCLGRKKSLKMKN